MGNTTVDDHQWFADQFETHRPHLRAVAYRMLGSVTEADDALQEAWIRTTRSDSTTINNINGWLTTLVGRVCIDMLRTRQSRRESLTGTWLPEPLVSTDATVDPEHASLLADSVGIALLVVLESLEPAERLAFVLHDMFGVPFDEIAPIVERTPVGYPPAREPSPKATPGHGDRPRRRPANPTSGRERLPRSLSCRRLRGTPQSARPRRRVPRGHRDTHLARSGSPHRSHRRRRARLDPRPPVRHLVRTRPGQRRRRHHREDPRRESSPSSASPSSTNASQRSTSSSTPTNSTTSPSTNDAQPHQLTHGRCKGASAHTRSVG